jgi:hypothetical protein
MSKSLKNRITALEGPASERPLIMAIKGLDGIAVEGETLAADEFKRRYPGDKYTIIMRSIAIEVGKL